MKFSGTLPNIHQLRRHHYETSSTQLGIIKYRMLLIGTRFFLSIFFSLWNVTTYTWVLCRYKLTITKLSLGEHNSRSDLQNSERVWRLEMFAGKSQTLVYEVASFVQFRSNTHCGIRPASIRLLGLLVESICVWHRVYEHKRWLIERIKFKLM